MLKQTIGFILGMAAAMAPFQAAHAEGLIPVVAFPGATATEPFDINDKNVIGGTYTLADGTSHAFFGSLDGQYTSFDGDSYDGYSQVNSVDESGWITGITVNATLCPDFDCGFVRKPDGTFHMLKKDGAIMQAYPRQIATGKNFVGSYLGHDQSFLSFKGHKARFDSDIVLNLSNPQARGVNSSGVTVGRFINDQGFVSAFVLRHRKATVVDYPDQHAINTYLYGINDSGLATGYWTNDDQGVIRTFVYDTNTQEFHDLTVPGASAYAIAEGINNKGFIAVRSDAGNYVYCPRKHCAGATVETSLGPALHALKERPTHAAQPAKLPRVNGDTAR